MRIWFFLQISVQSQGWFTKKNSSGIFLGREFPNNPPQPLGLGNLQFCYLFANMPYWPCSFGVCLLLKKEPPSMQRGKGIASQSRSPSFSVTFVFGPTWHMPEPPHAYSAASVALSGLFNLCGSLLGRAWQQQTLVCC